jgi:hypothetical protein
MSRSAAVAALALLAGSLLAADDPAPPSPDVVAGLVEQLGDPDYAKREDASRRLAEIGPAALPALREATASGDPEVARRADVLITRITRRVENEKLLAPTLVAVEAENAPLAAVLADLSEQSGYELAVAGPTPRDVLATRVTVKTGRVPFWEAVLATCDAAGLRIASVGGYVAPDARPPFPTAAVVLEPCSGQNRRPTVVSGAVCVEAVRVPEAVGVPDAPAALLQVWPEPGLNWRTTTAVRVDRATDDAGQSLRAALPTTTIRGTGLPPNTALGLSSNRPAQPAFAPSTRQFMVRLRPGARPSLTLVEFSGVVHGTVRGGPEPMIVLSGLAASKSVTGEHPSGAVLKATPHRSADQKWRASVDLGYDTARVQPAEPGERLGNLVNGIRVTDANGNAFLAVPTALSQQTRGGTTRTTLRMELDLLPTNNRTGDPDTITFWASFDKPASVPFALKNVPLVGRK